MEMKWNETSSIRKGIWRYILSVSFLGSSVSIHQCVQPLPLYTVVCI